MTNRWAPILFSCMSMFVLWGCTASPPSTAPGAEAGANPGEPGQTAAISGVPRELTPAELDRYLADDSNLFFLDVREPEEIRQLGSIEGYVNIPMGQLPYRLSEIPKDKLIITA